MKAVFAALALFSASSSFAADAVGDIKSLKVSFVDLKDGTTEVTLEGQTVGLACQKPFTHPELRLKEQDVDFNLYGIVYVANGPFVSAIVCLNDDQVIRDFKQTLVLETDHELYFSYIDGVEGLEQGFEGIPSSLYAVKKAASCAVPSSPVLESGFFGVPPALPEVCTFEIKPAGEVSIQK